jgi:hypothetical protein
MIAVTIFICLSCVVEHKTGGARRENKTPRAAIGHGEKTPRSAGRLQMACQPAQAPGKPRRNRDSRAPTKIARRTHKDFVTKTRGIPGIGGENGGAAKTGRLRLAPGICLKSNPRSA